MWLLCDGMNISVWHPSAKFFYRTVTKHFTASLLWWDPEKKLDDQSKYTKYVYWHGHTTTKPLYNLAVAVCHPYNFWLQKNLVQFEYNSDTNCFFLLLFVAATRICVDNFLESCQKYLVTASRQKETCQTRRSVRTMNIEICVSFIMWVFERWGLYLEVRLLVTGCVDVDHRPGMLILLLWYQHKHTKIMSMDVNIELLLAWWYH